MSQTLIIAEAGVNHNGDIGLAKELIDVAAESGADVVKFQTFKADQLVTNDAPMADYQVANTGKTQSQKKLLESLEITFDQHFELMEYCEGKNIEFLSTPFDLLSAQFLIEELKLKRIKVGSGLVNHAPYLHYIASTQVPVILSTGMCNLEEVKQALSVLHWGYAGDAPQKFMATFNDFQLAQLAVLKEKVSVLHCVTNYPCEFSEVNLNAMKTIENEFGLVVGYSDHSLGVEIPCAAVAMGAKIIEKHYTLDKNMEGPDHLASLGPGELKDMVTKIRHIEQAMGNGEKSPSAAEKKNIPIVRMSMVASKAIDKGEKFTEDNIAIRRPGGGESPMKYWDYLGATSKENYNPGDYIYKED